MTTSTDMRRKRAIVGLLSLGSVASAGGLIFVPGYAGLQSALVRIGFVLGAIWMALPTDTRPAAWASLTPWTVALVILGAILIPYLKVFIPIFVAGIAIGWFVRPRRKKG